MNNHQPADLSMERHYHSPKQRALSRKRWHIKIPLILLALFFLLSCTPDNYKAREPARTAKAKLIQLINARITEANPSPNLNDIDISNVENLSRLFENKEKFNGDISKWDTSHVTSMANMFSNASSFNGDISSWNTSEVTKMQYMFSNAGSFNGDISSWVTSKVTNMQGMFNDARSFDREINTAGNKWNTSQVTTMYAMFYNTKFNQNISGWDTTKVRFMSHMFQYNTAFDHDISGWKTDNVTSHINMFVGSTLAAAKRPTFP